MRNIITVSLTRTKRVYQLKIVKIHPYTISRSRIWRKTVIFTQALEHPKRWAKLINKLLHDKSISERLIEQANSCFLAHRKKRLTK